MTGPKTKGARITYHGFVPDTHPIYSKGWTFLGGKYLNPNLKGKSTTTDKEKERHFDEEQR